MSSEVVLQADKLTKVFDLYRRRYQKTLDLLLPYRFRSGKYTAVDNVSFPVHRGERFGIMGANGSGKSTLLQLISGTMTPTSGEVYADGRMVSLLELGSSFSPQFTGRENIRMAGYFQGLSRSEVERRLPSIVEFAELGDFIDQPLSTYSTGMMMRLAFATNIHIEADILLLDEIFAVGDAAFVRKCTRFLKDFLKDKTVLLVSHDINLIASLCDRALLLDHGRIACLGATLPVTEQYLEQCYGEKQTVSVHRKAALAEPPPEAPMDLPLRERLESGDWLFDREKADSPKTAPVQILDAVLTGANGSPLVVTAGGERVKLTISAESRESLVHWAGGFLCRDSRGEELFGDSTEGGPLPDMQPAGKFAFEMEFILPRLRNGENWISVALTGWTFAGDRFQIWKEQACTFRMNAQNSAELEKLHLPVRLQKISKHAATE